MVTVTKINSMVVKPLPIKTIDAANIRGYDLFPELYANIFLCARKKSGKTSTIYNILKKCADKRTKVIVFCATYQKDLSWIGIQEYLDSRSIPNEFHQSIHDQGRLTQLISEMQNEEDESSSNSEDEEEEPPTVIFGGEGMKIKRKKKKPKKVSPRYIIIMDDISTELKDKNIAQLLKTNRHFRSKVILSSQYLNDLLPMSRRQIDYYILFGGLSEQKLQEIYINADLDISFRCL
eukprot:Lithocolla_globosa_v1_NODE_146_length_5712_cov_12.381121.p4 type:complete len:235 gc:universal NODE_146_length_5712_cov_12.381121:4394-5098(+)